MLKKLLAVFGLIALTSCTEYVPPPAPIGYVIHFPGISFHIGGPAYVVRTYGAPQTPEYAPYQPPVSYTYPPRPAYQNARGCPRGYQYQGDVPAYARPQYAPGGVPVPQYRVVRCQRIVASTYAP